MKRVARWLGGAGLAVAGVYAALLVAAALNAGGSARETGFLAERPLVIAHQGGEGLWPGNTRLAFDRSAALGADVLDTDVHATRDGTLVAIHDASVNRTTNGRGMVKDLSFEELRQLDAAYAFTRDGGRTFPYRGRGLQVPTLDELLTAHPDVAWGVEIKQVDPPIARPLCDLLRARGVADRAVVSSFKDSALREFREACPEVATSMTASEVRPLVILNLLGLGGLYRPPGESLQVPERAAGLTVVNDRFVRVARRKNLSVLVWTVNEPEHMRRLLDLRVHGINTDRPDVLLRVLDRTREQ